MTNRKVVVLQLKAETISVLRRFWLPVMLVVLAVRIVVALANSFDTSVWSASAVVSDLLIWLLGGWVVIKCLPGLVANGATRGEFAKGVALFTAGLSIAMSAMITSGYGIERVIYETAGIAESLVEVNAFSSPEQVGMTLIAYTLTHAAHFCSGMLIACIIWRFGRWGVPCVPLCLIPPYVAEFTVDTQWGRWLAPNSATDAFYLAMLERLTFGVHIPFLAGALLSIAVISSGVFIAMKLLSRIDITRLDSLNL